VAWVWLTSECVAVGLVRGLLRGGTAPGRPLALLREERGGGSGRAAGLPGAQGHARAAAGAGAARPHPPSQPHPHSYSHSQADSHAHAPAHSQGMSQGPGRSGAPLSQGPWQAQEGVRGPYSGAGVGPSPRQQHWHHPYTGNPTDPH